MDIDTNKSLLQLESKGWKEKIPNEGDSYVIRNSYKLYHKKLNEFTVEDIRFMIGQGIGLEYVVPMSIEVLNDDLFSEGDHYEGDLLKNVLTISTDYWSRHPDLKKKVLELFMKNQQKLEGLDTTEEIKNDIREAFEEFKIK